ncbi:MAG: thioredoxin family protein [Bacteroidota bacterium]
MKRIKALIILLLAGSFTYAQSPEGIQFDSKLSWAQVKAKAKKEKKYIFLDVYTTWCVPCKVMAKNIFSQKEVGEFFNKNFINVAAQFDKTNKDNAYTKSWYKDIEQIHKTYKVDAYPTYLFFTPEGNLIHFIKGGTATGAEFIKKSEEALNPKTQYLQLKAQFDVKKLDTGYLSNLIAAAESARDISALPQFINLYLKSQSDLNTERNLRLIEKGTKNSTDLGFLILSKNFEQFDKIIGKKIRTNKMKSIIFDEVVFPVLKVNGVITEYGGGMVGYGGDMAPKVDWAKLKETLELKFPEYAQEFSLTAPVTYYEWSKDWVNFVAKTNEYLEKSSNIDYDKLFTWQNSVFLFVDDSAVLQAATNWTEKIPKDVLKSHPWYLKMQSRLLYKNGKKEDAIVKMKEAIALSGKTDEAGELEIKKMAAGEKI